MGNNQQHISLLKSLSWFGWVKFIKTNNKNQTKQKILQEIFPPLFKNAVFDGEHDAWRILHKEATQTKRTDNIIQNHAMDFTPENNEKVKLKKQKLILKTNIDSA